jgi:tetratricopeptide (TPR) repeat protein
MGPPVALRADLLHRRGLAAEALAAARRAVEAHRDVARREPSAARRVGLADTLAALSRIAAAPDPPAAEAVVIAKEAVDLYRQVAEEAPGWVANRSRLARALLAHGRLLERSSRGEEALAPYREAEAIRRALVADFPQTYAHHHDLAVALQEVAGAASAEVVTDEAIAAQEEAVATMEEAGRLFPDAHPQIHAFKVAVGWQGLAFLYHRARRWADEERATRNAAGILERLAAGATPLEPSREKRAGHTNPTTGVVVVTMAQVPDVADGLRTARRQLAHCLRRRGRFAEAESTWRRALEDSPGDPTVLREVAWTLVASPDARERRVDEALAILDGIGETSDAETWMIRAAALWRAERWDDCARALERTMALRDPPGGEEWFLQAMLEARRGAHGAARSWHERARAWRLAGMLAYDEGLLRIDVEASAFLGLPPPPDAP